MNKIAIVFFSVILFSCFSGNAFAQQKTSPKIASVKKKDNTVEFTITSARKFIMGNNRYVLHIGDKGIMRYRQSFDNHKKVGIITFLIEKT